MSDKNYKVAIDLFISSLHAGDARHEILIDLGSTPQVLIDSGLPELRLGITGKVIDKVYYDHGVTKGKLQALPSMLATPKAIYRSDHPHPPGSVVVTFESQNGDPLIVSIKANARHGRSDCYNLVTSVYGKGGDFQEAWKRNGLLLWEPK